MASSCVSISTSRKVRLPGRTSSPLILVVQTPWRIGVPETSGWLATGCEPRPGCGIALRIEVDEQGLAAGLGLAAARFKAVVVLPTPPF